MSLYLLTSPTGLIPPFISVVANTVTNAHVYLLNWMVLSCVSCLRSHFVCSPWQTSEDNPLQESHSQACQNTGRCLQNFGCVWVEEYKRKK